MPRFLALCLSVVGFFAALQTATSAEFLVTSTADSGPGSLRSAIVSANATAGPDEIHFNIEGRLNSKPSNTYRIEFSAPSIDRVSARASFS